MARPAYVVFWGWSTVQHPKSQWVTVWVWKVNAVTPHSTSVSTCPVFFPADATADFSQMLGGTNVCQDNPSSWQVRLINTLIEAAWWVHRCAVDRSLWVCSFITGLNVSQMLGALRGGSVRSLLCKSWKGMKKCSCSFFWEEIQTLMVFCVSFFFYLIFGSFWLY